MAYDREHDAVFYSGEFNNHIVRYDRRTRRFDDTASQDFVRRWFQPVSLEAFDGSLCLQTTSIHPGRNRIYLTDWMQGRYAYAVDLTTLRLVGRYDVGGGGAGGIAVDPERDRLFVSSLWGLEVFDLTTDRLIARKRLGLGNRPVIVDTARNRLYVSSTVEGKIRILDRDTFDVIGQIPIGIGSRYPYLSQDGKHLFASSRSAHYSWDADTLAQPQ
jgi:DNA-binding beta-propeller fold protein YncE